MSALFEVYPLFEVTPIKAKDIHIYDSQGRQYLDLYGGHAVISIGHAHPKYVKNLSEQLGQISFYSNSIQNPLQNELAKKIQKQSGCTDYALFLCNSGAEANENALKLASFHTGKKKVIAFKNGFHGRTSAAVAATDNNKIIAPINAQQEVIFCELEHLDQVEEALKQGDVCAIIVETIQGIGGLDEASTAFYSGLQELAHEHGALLIADEIQCGFGRTGDFFAFQRHGLQPDIISMAKGMGNGFPVGGILIAPHIKASYGLLGTTFGGSHLACKAVLTVLDVLEEEALLINTSNMSSYFMESAAQVPQLKKCKGRGLMLGLEFDFKVSDLRQKLIYKHGIFTGSSKNPNLLRILPPLTIQKQHIDAFFEALIQEV